jgi:hypothetical protein
VIDIGEAALTAVGADAIVFRTFDRFTAVQRDEVKGLDATIGKLARQLCRGELSGPDIRTLNYDRWLNELAKQPKEEDFAAWIGAFTDEQHAIATAFVGQAMRLLQYLRTIFPIQPIVTVTGTSNVEPSEVATGKFSGQLDLLDRAPESLFELIAEDSLTTSMAIDFMKVYPILYVACATAIVQAVTAEKARSADYEPEWERSLACLLGVPGMDPGLSAQLQQPIPDLGRPPPQRSSTGEGNPAHLVATPSQRTTTEQHP